MVDVAHIRANQGLIDLFQSRRIFSAQGGCRWRAGDVLTAHSETEIESYAQIRDGMVLPRGMGAFSYSNSALPAELTIGRYSAIGSRFTLMGGQHPIEWAAIAPFTYLPNAHDGVNAYFTDHDLERPPLLSFDPRFVGVSIGHDVWVGDEVMIKRGVRIGHGAVIAARSVVTRDVLPYSIVGGIPARLIRYRFSETLIQRLLQAQWWNYGPEVVAKLDVREPEALPDRLGEAVAAGARMLGVPRTTVDEMIHTVQPGAKLMRRSP